MSGSGNQATTALEWEPTQQEVSEARRRAELYQEQLQREIEAFAAKRDAVWPWAMRLLRDHLGGVRPKTLPMMRRAWREVLWSLPAERQDAFVRTTPHECWDAMTGEGWR